METDPEKAAERVRDLEASVGRDPVAEQPREDLGWALTDLARALRDLGDRSGAERNFRRALEVRSELARSGSRAARRDLARTHTDLGWLVEKVTRLDEAERCHREALALREALHAEAPDDAEATTDLAATLRHLASAARDAGRNAEAQGLYARAAALLEELAGRAVEGEDRVALLADLGWTRRCEGWLLERLGRPHEHLAAMRAAANVHERLIAEHPDHEDRARWQAKLGDALASLGRAFEEQDRFEEAEAALTEAVEALEASLAVETSHGAAELAARDLVSALRTLELVLHVQGRRPEALVARKRSRVAARKLRPS